MLPVAKTLGAVLAFMATTSLTQAGKVADAARLHASNDTVQSRRRISGRGGFQTAPFREYIQNRVREADPRLTPAVVLQRMLIKIAATWSISSRDAARVHYCNSELRVIFFVGHEAASVPRVVAGH